MSRRRLLSVSITLAAFLLLPVKSFGGMIFAFQYNIPAPTPSYASVSASGYLTTGDYDPILNGYLVQNISGTRTVAGILTHITGLIPVGAYYNSNVLYYPNSPLLDGLGLSFTVDQLGDDIFDRVNVFFDPVFAESLSTSSAITENAGFVYYGDFQVQAVPEPAPLWLLLAGCAGIMIIVRRRS